MTRQVVVTAQAEAELRQAAEWYDCRCLGLGRALLVKFELTVEQIRHFPESFERIDPCYRRALLGRFPYFVVYRIVTDTIRILRVMPEKGDPRNLTSLIGK